MTLPNKLTMFRIILIPLMVVVAYVPFFSEETYNIGSMSLANFINIIIFAVASATDFLDGAIARKYNLVTNLGKFLDPIADKVLVSTALIIMLLPIGGMVILPWYASIAVAVIIARELMISGFRIVAASKGLVLAADKTGKIKTFFQDISILVLLIGASFAGLYSIVNIIGLALLGISALLTIISGTEYIVKNISVLKD